MKQRSLDLISKSLLLVSFILMGNDAKSASNAQFGLSPDNSRSLLIRNISQAKSLIQINIYQMDVEEIFNALIDRMKAGVKVELLVEGEPLGGVSSKSVKSLLQLRDIMSEYNKPTRRVTRNNSLKNRLFIMTGARSQGVRRFVYNHAKYVIFDNSKVLVSSENFTKSGHPEQDKIGNRGWEIVLEDTTFVSSMIALFNQDTRPKVTDPQDVIELKAGEAFPKSTSSDDKPAIRIYSPLNNGTDDRPVTTIPAQSGVVDAVKLITSPNSMSDLSSAIKSSRNNVSVQQMSLPYLWKDQSGTPKLSPWIYELILAAKRGVQVSVLLNDESAFDQSPSDNSPDSPKSANELAVRYLLNMAKCYSLSINANIIDTNATGITYIHNKGMIIDDKFALVSSINGTKNSALNNREVAALVRSQDAARYFQNAYDSDWDRSKSYNKPINEPCAPLPSRVVKFGFFDKLY